MAKFHVKARTVDLLGRQQIAGIPTAISELLKNAHDAYSNTADIDYFREDRLFILRDDGIGMTRDDFEQRWLTIGTESKLDTKRGIHKPPVDKSQKSRPILGEKGIGRLAIAIIGSQVLVVTRAKDMSADDHTVVAYIHWGLFELPGVNLENIEIPIRELKGGELPSASLVKEMVDEVYGSLEDISPPLTKAEVRKFEKDFKNFSVDPEEYAGVLGEPKLTGNGHGTHFYIMPAADILEQELDYRDDEKSSTNIEKNLIGFTNTMIRDAERPPIVTRFRDYIDESEPIERIGEKAFFTPDEFQMADHHIKGRFDEYGKFIGTVEVYQMDPDPYEVNWMETEGKKTLCGPFTMSFAYIQGAPSDSLLSPDEHARMRRKLDRYGGLYIYRDGIRILPYGDSDYDFLHIEKRRNLGAAYYFYSYRRIFGVINITRKHNSSLTEKAGREGFQENKAYKQFRSILQNFFIQSAGDFFRDPDKGGRDKSEKWITTKDELNKREVIRRKEAKKSTVKKRELQKNLDKFFRDVSEKQHEQQAENIGRILALNINKIIKTDVSPTIKATRLTKAEQLARQELNQLQQSVIIKRPSGVGLSKQINSEWEIYLNERDRLDRETFQSTNDEIQNSISRAALENDIPIDYYSRLKDAIEEQTASALRNSKAIQKEISSSVRGFHGSTVDAAKAIIKEIDETLTRINTKLNDAKVKNFDELMLASLQNELEKIIQDEVDGKIDALDRIREQIFGLEGIWNKNSYTVMELKAAQEEELVELREVRDNNLELVQIGMALNTISHEFEKVTASLRHGFKRLKAWAATNPDLEALYQNMSRNFEHLDGYLSLFTPLDRRTQLEAIEITGAEIYSFLMDLFKKRITDGDVYLTATKRFKNVKFIGYPSSFYPVFINLVDNSLFWLKQIHDRKRAITLDADGDDMIVIDNGPGISARDRDNIFLLNFSRKPGGRGMGLFISRETLSNAGYELLLQPSDIGAEFRIQKKEGGD